MFCDNELIQVMSTVPIKLATERISKLTGVKLCHASLSMNRHV